MNDRYFFDKRVMKKVLLKYGIIFLIAIPILIFANFYLNKVMNFWLVILIDVVIVLTIIFIAQLIINAWVNHKENQTDKTEIKYKKKDKPVKISTKQENDTVVDAEIVETKTSAAPQTLTNKKKKNVVIKSNKKR